MKGLEGGGAVKVLSPHHFGNMPNENLGPWIRRYIRTKPPPHPLGT